MSINTDEAKRARAKQKRAAVNAKRQKRHADAKARDARIEEHEFTAHLHTVMHTPPPSHDGIPYPWEYDSRFPPPPPPRTEDGRSYSWDKASRKWILPEVK